MSVSETIYIQEIFTAYLVLFLMNAYVYGAFQYQKYMASNRTWNIYAGQNRFYLHTLSENRLDYCSVPFFSFTFLELTP